LFLEQRDNKINLFAFDMYASLLKEKKIIENEKEFISYVYVYKTLGLYYDVKLGFEIVNLIVKENKQNKYEFYSEWHIINNFIICHKTDSYDFENSIKHKLSTT
jgi:hypothetical protein